ncbi:MAG TPA: PQQ-binding-like beta-propeller repeat protein [Polyangiaceae bacterium]|nr:PQQ-binding-like beta-propeller repeat protein [Polyangiaceae bacterium]
MNARTARRTTSDDRWAAVALLGCVAFACSARPTAPRVALQSPAAPAQKPAAASAASSATGNQWWLAPRRKLDLKLEQVSVSAWQGDILARGNGTGAVWLRDGATRQEAAELGGATFWGVNEPVTAGWLLAKREGTLLAWNAKTSEPAWQLALGADAGSVLVARARDVALVSTRTPWDKDPSQMRTAFLGIDPKTAKVLWRVVLRNPHDGYGLGVATADTFWITTEVAGQRLLQALDAANGAVLWQQPQRFVQRLLADADHVVVIGDAPLGMNVETHAARSGAVLAESRVSGQFRDQALLDDGVLYMRGASLTARLVTTHAVLWDRPFPFDWSHGPAPHVSPMAKVAGAVVLCERGALHALAQKTGEELWSYGLDLLPCGSFAVAPGPRVYVARTLDTSYDSSGDDSIVEYAQTNAPPETATVHGHVSSFDVYGYGSVSPAGSEVLVGDTAVKVQADGSYEARVTTRGTLRVFVHVPLPNDQEEEKCDAGAQASAEFPLTGSGDYLADLQLDQRCW